MHKKKGFAEATCCLIVFDMLYLNGNSLMDTPLDVVQRRDPKGLYGKVARGETRDVVGIDIAWHPPIRPDLVIGPDRCPTPPDAAAAIARAVPRLADAWSALHT